MGRTACLAFAFVVVLVGCKGKAPEAREVNPPTAAEADAIGREFVAALSPCNATVLDALIDFDLMFARAVAGHRITAAEIEAAKKEATKVGSRGPGRDLCARAEGAVPTLLRVQTIAGAPHPLIRLAGADGSFGYLRLELDKSPRGTVRVADVYIARAGENTSKSMARGIDAMLATSGDGAVHDFERLQALVRSGKYQEAYYELRALPSELRDSKPLMLMGIHITAHLEAPVYIEAIDRFAAAYPGDPAVMFVQIDKALLQHRHDDVLVALDAIEKEFGPDPHLMLTRTEPLVALDRADEAIARLRTAIRAEPTLEGLHWMLFAVQAKTAKYTDALTTLDEINTRFAANVTLEMIAADERYATLAASDEARAWAARTAPPSAL